MTSKRLLLLALVVVSTYALVTQEKPTPPTPGTACDPANTLYNQGAYGEALARYQELIKQDPPPSCAATGAKQVALTRCVEAANLHAEGFDDSASKIYDEALLDAGPTCFAPHPASTLPKPTKENATATNKNSVIARFFGALGRGIARAWRWSTRHVGWLEFVVLLGLLLVYAIHVTRLRQLRRVLSVEVGDLTNATGDDDLDKSKDGLAALLRARLHAAGIPPPTVPGGAAQDSVITTVIDASPLPQAKFLAQFFKFLMAQLTPTAGHKMVGTLMKRADGKRGLTVTISDVYEGRTETVVAAWRDDYEEATEIAAAQVYEQVIAHLPSEAAIPGYMRWRGTGDSMNAFFQGKEAERDGDLEGALAHYEDSARLDPANALVRFQQANILTQQKEYLKALEIYLDTVLFWPDLFQARYRLAALYSFAGKWKDQWEALDGAKKEALRRAIAIAEGTTEQDIGPDGQRPVDWFLDRADKQFDKTLQAIDAEIDRTRQQRVRLMWWLYRRVLRWTRLFPVKLQQIRHLWAQKTMTVAAQDLYRVADETGLQRSQGEADQRSGRKKQPMERQLAGSVQRGLLLLAGVLRKESADRSGVGAPGESAE